MNWATVSTFTPQSWEAERNGQQVRVNWRFTPWDTRIKLKRLYPVLEKEDSEETAPAQPS